MPFIQAKCPECGGMLAVDDRKKAANCQFCGEAFIVQEAVNNYITNTITNNNTTHNYGEGAVVNIYENTSKDFVIEGGVLKKYQGASLTPVVPEGVVAIEGGAFKNSMITKVTLPTTLKELRALWKDSGTWKVSCIGAFEGCKYLEEINLPKGLADISANAFCFCSSLTSITIPDSVKYIGKSAFTFCDNLNAVYITDLAAWCSINFDFGANPLLITKNLYINGKLATDIVIPNGVTSVSNWAFVCCTSLISVTIPDSVTSIGEKAFSGCTNLVSVTIPDSVTSIGERAFSGCTNLVSVRIPESGINIGKDVFEGTPFLKDNLAKEAERQAEEKKLRRVQQMADYRSKGLCQHCGGTFKGLITKKCSRCGIEKNY